MWHYSLELAETLKMQCCQKNQHRPQKDDSDGTCMEDWNFWSTRWATMVKRVSRELYVRVINISRVAVELWLKKWCERRLVFRRCGCFLLKIRESSSMTKLIELGDHWRRIARKRIPDVIFPCWILHWVATQSHHKDISSCELWEKNHFLKIFLLNVFLIILFYLSLCLS